MAMQYIGARYVPIFYTNPDDGSASWKANVDYESFTIVVEDGDSYTSKKAVPKGIGKPSENPIYWVKTGDFNASLLALQTRVRNIEDKNGNEPLETEAQTFSGAINELKNKDDGLDERLVSAENNISKLTIDSKVVFMPVNKDVPYATYASGDCTVFITKNNKVVMIDTGASHSWIEIHAKLEELGITFIDYFILSHYHADHYENLTPLIAGNYITAETVSYLPRYAGTTVSGVGDEQWVRDTLAFTTIIAISSDVPLIVDDMRFDFFNCDKSDYDYYNSIGTTYNNYSVCCYVTYKGSVILMAADLMTDGMTHVLNEGYIHKCDILKFPHHGMPNGLSDFYIATQAKYGIISVCYNDIERDVNEFDMVRYATIIGIEMYACGYGDITVGLSDHLYSVLTVSPIIRSGRNNQIVLTVDSSNTEYGNGTEANPFKDIRYALAYASTFNTATMCVINIKGAYTYTGDLYIYNMPCKLYIFGEDDGGVHQLTFNGKVSIQGCQSVLFEKVNFLYTGQGIAFEAYMSNSVYLTNCSFNGEQKTGDESAQRCISANLSTIQLQGCVINDKGVAMVALSGKVYGNYISGSSITALVGGYNGEIKLANVTASYTKLVGYAATNFEAKVGTDIGYKDIGEFMAFRSIKGTGAAETVTFDFSDSIYSEAQITVKCRNGSEYKLNRFGSGLTLTAAIQQTVVGTIEPNQTVSLSTNLFVLSITHNYGIEVFVRR